MGYRILATSDMELIRQLDRAIFPSDELVEPDELQDARWFVVMNDKQPIAFGGVVIDGGHAFLVRAGVMKDHRGKRLQRRLIRVRERHAMKAGAKWIGTYTSVTNPQSVNTLVNAGYRQYIPEWAWAGREFLYWWKRPR